MKRAYNSRWRGLIAAVSVILVFTASLSAEEMAPPFATEWELVQEAIRLESPALLTQAVIELEQLRIESGFSSLSTYSLSLLDEAQNFSGKPFERSLVESALILSSQHPTVQYRAYLYVSGQTTWEALGALVRGAWGRPSVIAPGISMIIYPLLFAVTFGFLLTAAFLLVTSSVEILRPFYRVGSRFNMPQLFACLVVVVAGACITLGPLAAVAFLALVLSLRDRWFLLWGGALLLTWGFIIPLHENFREWSELEEMHAVFRVLEGDFAPGDLHKIRTLAEQREDDPLVRSALAVALRQVGNLPASREELELLEDSEGSSGWISVQKGLNAYLEEDAEAADHFFAEAISSGQASVPVLFFASKAKFDLRQTEESHAFYTEARRIDKDEVVRLEEEEALFGQRYRGALSAVARPSSYYRTSATVPILSAWIDVKTKARTLFMPFTWQGIAAIGGVLLLLFFIPRDTTRRSQFICYMPNREGVQLISILPGGLFAAASKPAWAIPVASLFFGMVFVVFGWPFEVSQFFSMFPDLTVVVVGLFLVPIALSYVVGWRFYRGVRR